MRTLHALLPEGLDDPRRPSGGNVYDRRLCEALRRAGWTVEEHHVPGRWPHPDAGALTALAAALAGVPDAGLALVDGLVASAAAEVVAPAAGRLRLVVLVHMPLGHGDPARRDRERQALAAVPGVVTTSRWTAEWLLAHYGLDARRVHVAEPGVCAAEPAHGSPAGGELLCVAAVTHGKGHDLLVGALAEVTDLPWRCTCAGSLEVDAGFSAGLRRRAAESGIGDRLRFTGALAREELDARYAEADLLVLASRAETYGMVVTEALARGIPVLATAVGGVPEALGRLPDGRTPGILVPPGDAAELAAALRLWLTDDRLRRALRDTARERRPRLHGWTETARSVSEVLAGLGRHAAPWSALPGI